MASCRSSSSGRPNSTRRSFCKRTAGDDAIAAARTRKAARAKGAVHTCCNDAIEGKAGTEGGMEVNGKRGGRDGSKRKEGRDD
jgi:hypothetical protein